MDALPGLSTTYAPCRARGRPVVVTHVAEVAVEAPRDGAVDGGQRSRPIFATAPRRVICDRATGAGYGSPSGEPPVINIDHESCPLPGVLLRNTFAIFFLSENTGSEALALGKFE
jgi:hypothetical protein